MKSAEEVCSIAYWCLGRNPKWLDIQQSLPSAILLKVTAATVTVLLRLLPTRFAAASGLALHNLWVRMRPVAYQAISEGDFLQ